MLFGYATTIIPRIYTYYVSTALFAIFGVRMLREGLRMSPDEGQEELEEVQAEIKKKDEEVGQLFYTLDSDRSSCTTPLWLNHYDEVNTRNSYKQYPSCFWLVVWPLSPPTQKWLTLLLHQEDADLNTLLG